MVIIACISCCAVIPWHDQWQIFIIVLNYADRWKSCVRVPTCDGWLNWTNDSPCSTAHSSVMPIRVRCLVREGPSSRPAYQCPSPITLCTSVYATHYDDTTDNLCGAVFDPDSEMLFFFFFPSADCVDMGSCVSYAHLCTAVFTHCEVSKYSPFACVQCHAQAVLKFHKTVWKQDRSKEQLDRFWFLTLLLINILSQQ